VMSNKELKFAATMSVTRLVYQACVNSTTSANLFPKMLMGEFCSLKDSVVSRQLIPWLNEQLNTAVDDIERIAMLAALGNLGNEIIVPTILPHIATCEPSSRYEAEWYQRHRRSMRKLAEGGRRRDQPARQEGVAQQVALLQAKEQGQGRGR